MTQTGYIQVIVPLKLDQTLTYRVPGPLQERIAVGDRVKVRVGTRLTDAVVSMTDVVPGIDPGRIREIEGLDEGLEPITPEEIRFWQFLADYYLCTVGEVFKCAYPGGKIRSEETAARVRQRAEASDRKLYEAALLRVTRLEAEIEAVHRRTEEALAKLTERGVKTRAKLIAHRDGRVASLQASLEHARALADRLAGKDREVGKGNPSEPTQSLPPAGKPVLLQGPASQRFDYYRDLISDTLSQGRGVLLLVPEISLTEEFEAGMRARFGQSALVFHSRETTAQRRKLADRLREGGPTLLIGTRSALFLPYKNLGLIIVDEEQDRSYKQDSPAPRYNARDCAVVLAGIHGAAILLGSGAPSLESLFNCAAHRYTGVTLDPKGSPAPQGGERLKIIDTAAERRKRGMKGSFSYKLLDEIRYTLDQGGTVYLIRLWGDLAPTVEEARALFPDVPAGRMDETGASGAAPRIQVCTLSQTKRLTFKEGSLVALLQADPILGVQNFRADERAFQLLDRYREHCAAGTFVIQTSRSAHPVFQDLRAGRQPWPGLLEERKTFGYPPYSRLVDIDFVDPNPKRLSLMCRALTGQLTDTLFPAAGPGLPRMEGPFETGEDSRTLRVILPKDRWVPERKKALREAVEAFSRERKYAGFIHLDVDPE